MEAIEELSDVTGKIVASEDLDGQGVEGLVVAVTGV